MVALNTAAVHLLDENEVYFREAAHDVTWFVP